MRSSWKVQAVAAARIWRCVLALLLAQVAIAGTAAAADPPAQLTLRLQGSEFEFTGRLRSFDGRSYLIDAGSFGLLALDAARYHCAEGACPAASAPLVADASAVSVAPTLAVDFKSGPAEGIRIAGSSTIGLDLMPALIRDYAASLGGSARQLVGADPAVTRFAVAGAAGSTLTTIELARETPTTALAGLAGGKAAVAMSSRPLEPAEVSRLLQAAPGSRPLDAEHVLALDGLVVIVAPQSPVGRLGLDVVARIFSGQITNWSELGLPPAPIHVYASAEGEAGGGSLDALLLKPRRLALKDGVRRVATEAALSDAVAADPAGIAITSLAFVRNARGIEIAGSCGLVGRPTTFAVRAEEYPLSRRLYLYTAGVPRQATARDLLAFAATRRAQAVIRDSQFVDQDIEEASFQEQRRRIEMMLEAPGIPEAERNRLRALVAALLDARRLSITFRFSEGSAQLDAKAREDVVRLRQWLAAGTLSGKTVLLVGFTDSAGSVVANQLLSERRAAEVREAVLADDPRQTAGRAVVTAGMGHLAPVVCNDGPEAMRLNRRVEVWVVDVDRNAFETTLQRVHNPAPEPGVPARKRRRRG